MSLIPSILGKKSSVYDPFSLAVDVWDPFHGFGFGELSRPQFHLAKEASAVANTQIDWKETPEAHIFKADLPGLKKEEVQIQVEEGRILQISGQRSKEEEQNSDKWHRIERSHGRFLRRFRLPEAANVEEIRAALDDGVLTVTVPKQSQPKPDVKSVQISG